MVGALEDFSQALQMGTFVPILHLATKAGLSLKVHM